MNLDRDNSSTCERADDLIAVIYGEANEREKREFEVHLKQCAGCLAEFAAFAQVRASIGEWRDEALSGFVASSAPIVPAKKSGLAALRQFFDLSPVWMKGAVAFGVVIFCVLIALTVGRLREPADVPSVANGTPQAVYSEQDLQRIVREALAKQNAEHEREQASNTPAQVRPVTIAPVKNSTVANSSKPHRAQRPFTRAERDQLAAELRLLSTSEENDLELPDK